MKKSILTLLLCGASLALFQSNLALGACNPRCEQGQTCRFEQPNTYYCQNINGVQGSQQSSMGAANSNAMQPRGGYDPRANRSNSAKAGAANMQSNAPANCSSVVGSCVMLNIDGYQSVHSDLAGASMALLQQSLERGYVGGFKLELNEQARGSLSAQAGILAPYWDNLMGQRFGNVPTPDEMEKLTSLIPPVTENILTQGVADQASQLMQMYGYEAMQAQMENLKNIAIGSGGSLEPMTMFVISTALTVGIFIYQEATSGPSPTDENGDFDGDGIPNWDDKDKDGDGVPAGEDSNDWNKSEQIIAEKDRFMNGSSMGVSVEDVAVGFLLGAGTWVGFPWFDQDGDGLPDWGDGDFDDASDAYLNMMMFQKSFTNVANPFYSFK